MTVKLLTEHHLEFLSLRGGCTGSSESTHIKIPHCWKSHIAAQLFSEPVDKPITDNKKWNGILMVKPTTSTVMAKTQRHQILHFMSKTYKRRHTTCTICCYRNFSKYGIFFVHYVHVSSDIYLQLTKIQPILLIK